MQSDVIQYDRLPDVVWRREGLYRQGELVIRPWPMPTGPGAAAPPQAARVPCTSGINPGGSGPGGSRCTTKHGGSNATGSTIAHSRPRPKQAEKSKSLSGVVKRFTYLFQDAGYGGEPYGAEAATGSETHPTGLLGPITRWRTTISLRRVYSNETEPATPRALTQPG
jgi:hypothetical protein